MEKSSKTVRMRTILLSLLFLTALFCEVTYAQDKHIDVTVQNDKLVFLNSECPDREGELGCVTAEFNTSPVISWELTGPGAEQWRFEGLSFTPTPLQDCTVKDFELSEADRQSGTASTAQVVAAGKRLQIRDRNKNVCVSHYLLTAVSDDGRRIDSDPVIVNKGGM